MINMFKPIKYIRMFDNIQPYQNHFFIQITFERARILRVGWLLWNGQIFLVGSNTRFILTPPVSITIVIGIFETMLLKRLQNERVI